MKQGGWIQFYYLCPNLIVIFIVLFLSNLTSLLFILKTIKVLTLDFYG
jgi:hypothetical protein